MKKYFQRLEYLSIYFLFIYLKFIFWLKSFPWDIFLRTTCCVLHLHNELSFYTDVTASKQEEDKIHSLVSDRRALRLLQELVLIFFTEQSRQPVPAFGPGPLHLDTKPRNTGSKVRVIKPLWVVQQDEFNNDPLSLQLSSPTPLCVSDS